MRRLLLAWLACLALAAPAAAASKVQDGEGTASFAGDGIDARSFPGATTTGNVAVCLVYTGANDRDVTGITDTGSNSWSSLGGRDNTPSGDEATVSIWGASIATSFTTLTVTISSAFGGDARIDCYEINGATLTSAVTSNGQGSATTNHASGNVTITGTGALIGGTYGSGGTYTADGAWTSEASTSIGVTVTRMPGAGGTYSFTNTTSANENTISVVVGLNASGGGGGTIQTGPIMLPTLGVGL